MKFLGVKYLVLVLFVLCFVSLAAAQSADDRGNFGRPGEKDELPSSVKETLFKMQVDEAKKEHQELLDRAQELVAITDELEKSVEINGNIASTDIGKLAAAEKLAKKIRGGLGGGDDDEESDVNEQKPKDRADGIKLLRREAGDLMEELKKSSRFTISVVAIQSSNAVLRVVRFLRTGN
jgi:hypothetical protein